MRLALGFFVMFLPVWITCAVLAYAFGWKAARPFVIGIVLGVFTLACIACGSWIATS